MNACILWIIYELEGKITCCRSMIAFFKIIFVSICASLLQLLLLFAIKSYVGYLWLALTVCVPLMVFGSFGWLGIRVFCRQLLMGYCVAIGVGGLVLMLENVSGKSQLPIWMGVLSVFGVKKGIRFGKREWQKRKKLYPVSIVDKGKEVYCTALWDTGNQLREPIGGRTVHIVDREIIEQLGISAENYVGLAGYSSLGATDCVLPLYEVEQLCVWEDGRKKQIQNHVVVGCAGKKLMENRTYKVILNAEGIVI